MADILISKFTTQIPRVGATPATPGFAESEGQDPVAPSGTPQVYTPVTIGSPANGLSIDGTQVLTIGLASTSDTGALSSTDWNTFNGKIGGSIASGQVAFGTGTGTIGGDNGLTWDNTLKSLSLGGFYLAPIHVGNRNVSNSSRSQILISREILSASGNDHAFSDSSLYSPTANGLAYNSFDARINIGGSSNLDHYAAFQDGTVSNNTGTITNYWGHISAVTINSGTVANFQHVDINNVLGAGSITNQFGIRVRELTKGTNNWAIYTDGSTRSYFGGRVAIGVSNNPDKLLEIRTANGTESGLRIRQLSQNFWDIFSPASSTSLSIGDVGGVRWSFLTGGIFESNGAQTIRSSTGNFTIATGASNGNIIASPNGTGRVGINTTTIYAKLQTNANTAGSIPALGTTNDSASLAISTQFNSYGLLAGVLSTGNVWMQAQRFTGAADAFNLILQPSGGNVLIGTTSGTNTLDVNGTARIRTINNLGTAATSVLVPSATGVLSLRTLAELASDGGFGLSGLTINRIPKAASSSTINNSIIIQEGSTRIGVLGYLATVNLQASFSVVGTLPDFEQSVVWFRNGLNNVDTNPTTAFDVLRLERAAKSGTTFPSMASFGVARYENVGSNGRTELVIKLIHGASSTPERDILKIRSSGEFIYFDGSNLSFGTTTGTKIGTATNQKLGFYNATPIIQPSGDILTALSNLGLVASPTITQVDQFAVKTTASADQTLPSGTLTILDYDSTLLNNSTATYTVGTTGRITINTTGVYTITAGVVIEADAVTALESAFLGIFRNGDLVAISSINTTIAAGAQSGLSTSTILSLTATDIIDCRALVNSVGGVANGLARRLGTLLGANATQVNSLSITKNSM